MQETFRNGSGEHGRARCKGEQDQGRGHCEGEPRSKTAQETVTTQDTKGKTNLAGGRSRKKLTERDQVGIGVFIEPFAPNYQLVPEITEMGYGSSERSNTKFEEDSKDLSGRTSRFAAL